MPAWLAGLLLGGAYGLFARFGWAGDAYSGPFAVMTFAFLFITPLVIGYLAVRPAESPSLAYQVFMPWVPNLLVVAAAFAIGWEGSICIVRALPILLIFGSAGGLMAGTHATRRAELGPLILALPYIVAPLESRTHERVLLRTETSIEIAAPPSVVWPLVASVDSIPADQLRTALYTSIGFPRPVSATLTEDARGRVRIARFDRGIRFVERVTDWQPGRRISFTIRPDPVPVTTLDPHVTIGGPYFDVLTGTYELTEMGSAHTRLVLRIEHRVATPFNTYAGWWADRIMKSIQANILDVIRRRSEALTPRAGHPAA
jgi:hypothetical protein